VGFVATKGETIMITISAFLLLMMLKLLWWLAGFAWLFIVIAVFAFIGGVAWLVRKLWSMLK
jgi:hypothetical protein